MTHAQSAADDGLGGRKTYSVNVQVKAQSSTSCSFCYFVLTLYPTLKGMTDRDIATFKSHLQTAHGLRDEIQA
jgi:hypothetical protein